jgi:transposase
LETFYSGVSLRRVRDLFAVKFSNRHRSSKSTIRNYIRKFEETGSVVTKSRGGNKRNSNYALEEMVLGVVTADPTSSTRTIAENCNVTPQAVWKILRAFWGKCENPLKPSVSKSLDWSWWYDKLAGQIS